MKDIEFLKSKGVDVDKSLEIFGDVNTYNDSLGEFVSGIDEKIKKLAVYKNNSDMQNYAIYVHSLKSDAKYFGFNSLSEMAYEHEMKSKAMDSFYVSENFSTLEAEVMKTKNLVKEYLSGSPDSSSSASVNAPTEEKEEKSGPVEVSAEAVAEATSNESAPAKEEKPAEDDFPSDAPIYDRETILVVDDSNIIRNFVKRLFSDKYGVDSAGDGDEAIDILKVNKDNDMIISILLDLNMPKANGFKVLDYMKENDLLKKCPVSIISGDSSKETIDRAFTYGIVDMLGKPFNATDVKKIVEKNIYYKEVNKD